ncbi:MULTISPECIES: hypothetical protein [unclassified Psychrobacter]|uniref:hypothetical protein n=1 Tax=unclassified Psychrobacter TaxID=196806 RepID=UPI0018F74111|nr:MULTISPECIES: hypothetical protein [unclassified Psychrobacter]
MSKKTSLITYNLSDRGRPDSVGMARRVNVKAWVDFINSSDVQHVVDSGDMYGYIGHEIRQRFGLRPPDSFVDQSGKVVYLEPAFRTIKLSANARGDVSAQHEFLDTDLGKHAAQRYHSKAGGYSTAVRTGDSQDGTILLDFAGFDQVLMPNYNTNRGDGTFDALKIVEVGGDLQFDNANPQQQAVVHRALEAAIAHQYDSIHAMIAAQNMSVLHQQELLDVHQTVIAMQTRQDNIKKRRQSREDELYDSMLCPSISFAEKQAEWAAFADSTSEQDAKAVTKDSKNQYEPPRESIFTRMRRGG